MIKPSKTNVDPYSYYSVDGSGTVPIRLRGILDGSGGTVTFIPDDPVYVVGTAEPDGVDNITDISAEPVNEEAGINFQVSLNNTEWYESVVLNDMVVLPSAQRVYLRALVANDGSVATNNYTLAKLRIIATENPAA